MQNLAKCHLAFNIVEGLLALAAFTAACLFTNSINIYLEALASGPRTGLPVKLVCTESELRSTVLNASMPCIFIFLALCVAVHIGNPILINHISGFKIDWQRLIQSSAIPIVVIEAEQGIGSFQESKLRSKM